MGNHKHIRMIIRTDGTCTIDAVNFTDATCTQATQQIAEALSAQVIEERDKPEARIRQRAAHGRMEGAR